MNYVLIVLISTLYNSSIDFQVFNSKQKCEDAAIFVKAHVSSATTECKAQ